MTLPGRLTSRIHQRAQGVGDAVGNTAAVLLHCRSRRVRHGCHRLHRSGDPRRVGPDALQPGGRSRRGARRADGGGAAVRALADRYGRKRILMVCVGFFGLASLGHRLLELARHARRAALSDRPSAWVARCELRHPEFGIFAREAPLCPGDDNVCGFTLGSALGGVAPRTSWLTSDGVRCSWSEASCPCCWCRSWLSCCRNQCATSS